MSDQISPQAHDDLLTLPAGIERIDVWEAYDIDARMCALFYTYKGRRYRLMDENGGDIVLFTYADLIKEFNLRDSCFVERKIEELAAKLKKFGLIDTLEGKE